MTKEIWKDIVGYEGYYQVSSLGRVKSIDRDVLRCDERWQHCKSHILIPFQGTTCNYLSIQLSKDNSPQKFLLHRLVAIAFLGLNPITELEVNHKDGNRHNNKVENLEIVSHQQNIDHSVVTGLKHDYGENHVHALLTNLQANEIRKSWHNGAKQKDLAVKYRVSKQAICNIVHYKTYFK